jgi:HEAT repeat protein
MMEEILARAKQASEQQDWTLVTQCLHQLPWNDREPLTQNAALKLALQVLREGDFQQRWDVVNIFSKMGTKAIAPLLEILQDKSAQSQLRWFVGRILSEFNQPEVIFAFVKLLRETEEEDLAVMAAQSLANIGTSAIGVLQQLLLTEDTRLLAVQALAQIRRSDTIETLLQVVNDPEAEIRATAIEALGSFHDLQIVPVLLQGLKDTSAPVRKEAIIALSMLKDRYLPFDLVQEIKPLLYDPNQQVCQQAALALGRVGTKEAAGALFPILKSPATSMWFKIDIVRALSWNETVEALEYLGEGLRWGDPEICQEIVTVLGRKIAPHLKVRATQILLEFLQSGQQAARVIEVQQVLAMALGELREITAIETLEQLAEGENQSVRLHAQAALRKLISG